MPCDPTISVFWSVVAAAVGGFLIGWNPRRTNWRKDWRASR
jgi:hypothetical protein